MMREKKMSLLGLAALLPLLLFAAGASAQNTGTLNLDVPYVPTPQSVVNRMLQMGETGPNDIIYDLGSGDGRIVVTAARDFKVRKGIGVDLDPVRIAEANANAKAAGVTDRVKFLQTDLFKFDFSEASVLTLYLLPDVNMLLRPIILEKLKPGTHVISHSFTMGNWEADRQEIVEGEALYLWIVPAKVAGTWEWKVGADTYSVDLLQENQVVRGTLHAGGVDSPLVATSIKGEDLKFGASVLRRGVPILMQFNGKATSAGLTGTVDFAGGQKTQVTATRAK